MSDEVSSHHILNPPDFPLRMSRLIARPFYTFSKPNPGTLVVCMLDLSPAWSNLMNAARSLSMERSFLDSLARLVENSGRRMGSSLADTVLTATSV